MPHYTTAALLFLAAVTLLLCRTATGSTIPVTRCNPASHICEGTCPSLPPGAELPDDEEQGGLCLKDEHTGACVCWLRNPVVSPEQQQHLQTLFRCQVVANNTAKHVMCLPPPICFPPEVRMGCMIVLQCPCAEQWERLRMGLPSQWRRVVALILRSKTPVPALNQGSEGTISEKPQGDIREFSVKHLLFLLAFVIAPLLCWCLLTFFHEGKCRKKRRSPETEPMPTERVEEVTENESSQTGGSLSSSAAVQAPTAPKMESPPPYGETFDPGESCPLAADCGPPPTYEEAVRDLRWETTGIHRIQDV